MSKEKNHTKEAEKIYNAQGQSAVFDYANQHKIPYVYCQPCETNSPSHNGSCLVCGTANNSGKKKWFRIDEPSKTNDEVEYAVDYKFFAQHQIRVVRSGVQHSFCSNLESKTFRVVKAVNREGRMSEVEIEAFSRLIHQEILAGKHGTGKFVD